MSPWSILPACSVPSCPNRSVKGGYGRCGSHAAAYLAELRTRYPDTRPSSTERGYDAAWEAIRSKTLHDRPWCVQCEQEGAHTVATDVHHEPAYPTLGTDHRAYTLSPLCHSHHSRLTAEKTGWGARRKETR